MRRVDSMESKKTLSRLFGIVLIGMSQLCLSAELSNAAGTRLARAVYDRPTGDDSSSYVVMRLKKKGKNTQQRLLYSYAKEKGAGERWSLMRFVDPKSIDGTGLMTLDHPGDESDQWLYLPALDRVRRISSARKGGRFVGSDFFYEDLKDREVEMDHHLLSGQGKVGEIACQVLVSTPRDSDNSVYSKRVSCIHPKLLIPLRIDLYDKDQNQPVKRLLARKIKKIQGYWTILDSTMYDLKTGHQTQLFTKRIKYNQNLPDALFTQQALSDDSKERAYRP